MSDTVVKYWGISLAAGLAVVGIVALLLGVLCRTSEQILQGSAQIWQVGKLISNNTVHVALLGRVNQNLSEVSDTAEAIARAANRIHGAASSESGREGRK